MPPEPEDFLGRWARRKRASAARAVTAPAVPQPQSPLPALESLSFESDFKAFMHAKVDEVVKRAALRKLFGDPSFNIMDGLDTYIDDYSIEDPIPPGMLAQLQHAKTTLFGPTPQEEGLDADLPAEGHRLVESQQPPIPTHEETGAKS
jgi:hypothetical protein